MSIVWPKLKVNKLQSFVKYFSDLASSQCFKNVNYRSIQVQKSLYGVEFYQRFRLILVMFKILLLENVVASQKPGPHI